MVLNALDPSDHARMRKDVASAFSEKAVRAQEGLIEQYATKLVSSLEQVVSNSEKGVVLDITGRINFAAFDCIGDLAFGESFNCLESNDFILGPFGSWRLSRLLLLLPRCAIILTLIGS